MLTHTLGTPIFRAKVVLAVVVGALLSIALFTGKAQALGTCPYTGAEQVFEPWGDSHNYVLAPDGGFEAGAQGWALRGAKTVDGNESFYLNDAGDSRSLSLPDGSSAVSPSVCMSIDTPILRMMARNTGDPSSRLRVEATYKLLGLVRTKTVSNITAGSAWVPTQQMSTVLTLSTIIGTLIPAAIQVRVMPLDTKGEWQVDDFYVDPFARR
jgi:hypothetical protein